MRREFDSEKAEKQFRETSGYMFFGRGCEHVLSNYSKWLDQYVECPKCKGKGDVPSKEMGYHGDLPPEKAGQPFYVTIRRPCINCNGFGKVQRIFTLMREVKEEAVQK